MGSGSEKVISEDFFFNDWILHCMDKRKREKVLGLD
jgi:hypothetical protein